MWELDHKQGLALKNWCFWIVVLDKTLESPLDCRDIKSVNPKGNQLWISIRRSDAEAEALILWPPDVKIHSLKNTLMLEKIEGKMRSWWQRVRWLDGIIESTDMNLSKLWETGRTGVLQSMRSQRVRHDWAMNKHSKYQRMFCLSSLVVVLWCHVLYLILLAILILFLCMVWGSVLTSLIYIQLSSFPNTTFWRDCLFSIAYSWLLLKINWLQTCEFISGISILFHWSKCLFLFQYHVVLITVTLKYCLKSLERLCL